MNNHQYDSPILPLLLSVLVHGALLAWLLLGQSTKPLEVEMGIQTELVSHATLADVENQIRANAEEAAAQTAPSESVQAYKDNLAKKEAQFQKQIAQFNAEQELQTQAQLQALQEEHAEQQQKDQQALQDLQQAFDNHEQIVKQNQQELEEARKRRDEAIAEAQRQAQMVSATPQTDKPSHHNTNVAGVHAGLDDAVRRHIEQYWNSNALKGRVSATIELDSQANIKDIRFDNPHSPLVPTLEKAIRAASPITPLVGKDIRTVKINFSTE